jgi:hypothetical protein
MLYKKISEVMKDVRYLKKDDNVSTGGSGSYKAISEEKVTETIRASLIRNGLVILPVEQEHKRDDTLLENNGKQTVSRLTTVNTKYKIVDIETGEFEILASSGTGVDTQDKGVGKAMTYSYKYLLLRTFAIPTGEDPDKISSTTIDKEQQEFKHIESQKPSKVQMLALVELAKHKGIDLQHKSEEITGKTASKDWTMQDYFNIKNEIDDIKDKVS